MTIASCKIFGARRSIALHRALIVIAFIVLPTHVYAQRFALLTFNVQNLFDAHYSGEEYSGFQPPAWSEDDYQKRLIGVGKALQSVARCADVIVLQEVENKSVVRDLQKYFLPKFTHAAVTDNKYGAMEVAVLSRYGIQSVRTHEIFRTRETKSMRPILEVRIVYKTHNKDTGAAYSELQILAVHLKSRRHSGKSLLSSDEIRRMQYKLLSALIDQSAPTVIAGDFNDFAPATMLEAYNAGVTAVPVRTDNNAVDYTGARISGTYYHRSRWQQIDHIIFDTVFNHMFSSERVEIIAKPPFITDKGLPNRAPRGRVHSAAVSDHLPLLLTARQ